MATGRSHRLPCVTPLDSSSVRNCHLAPPRPAVTAVSLVSGGRRRARVRLGNHGGGAGASSRGRAHFHSRSLAFSRTARRTLGPRHPVPPRPSSCLIQPVESRVKRRHGALYHGPRAAGLESWRWRTTNGSEPMSHASSSSARAPPSTNGFPVTGDLMAALAHTVRRRGSGERSTHRLYGDCLPAQVFLPRADTIPGGAAAAEWARAASRPARRAAPPGGDASAGRRSIQRVAFSLPTG